MSENTTPTPAPNPEKPADTGSGIVSKLGLGTIIGALTSLISGALGASWPGVIALGAVGVSLPIIITKLINGLNAKTDKADQERAGADSGKTAVDLANQAKDVREGLDKLENLKPPKQS